MLAVEVIPVKLTSVREFRSDIASYTKKGEMMMITSHGRLVGCFLPLTKTEAIPIELKREFVASLGGQIAAQLSLKKADEKEILHDFKEFKKSRRG
jgi:hypothetical protein